MAWAGEEVAVALEAEKGSLWAVDLVVGGWAAVALEAAARGVEAMVKEE